MKDYELLLRVMLVNLRLQRSIKQIERANITFLTII